MGLTVAGALSFLHVGFLDFSWVISLDRFLNSLRTGWFLVVGAGSCAWLFMFLSPLAAPAPEASASEAEGRFGSARGLRSAAVTAAAVIGAGVVITLMGMLRTWCTVEFHSWGATYVAYSGFEASALMAALPVLIAASSAATLLLMYFGKGVGDRTLDAALSIALFSFFLQLTWGAFFSDFMIVAPDLGVSSDLEPGWYISLAGGFIALMGTLLVVAYDRAGAAKKADSAQERK
jgi:hypothetical protein